MIAPCLARWISTSFWHSSTRYSSGSGPPLSQTQVLTKLAKTKQAPYYRRLLAGDPEGIPYSMQYFSPGWYPIHIPREIIAQPHIGKVRSLTPEEREQVAKGYGKFSLRQLARRYGVSYETIRRAFVTQNTD